MRAREQLFAIVLVRSRAQTSAPSLSKTKAVVFPAVPGIPGEPARPKQLTVKPPPA